MQALPQQGRSYSATMRQGRYALRLSPTLGYQVDVPDLWTVVSGTFLNAGPQSDAIFFVAPAPASTGLALHPCRDHTTRVVGPTVSDLAGALRRQPVLDVTKPVPVTLDGYRGLYLEVTIPDEVDADSCVDDRVSLFESGGPDGYIGQDGYVGRWWILEVDGERIVVMPQCDTGCTEDDFDTLTTMAESITFTPAISRHWRLPSSACLAASWLSRLWTPIALTRSCIAPERPSRHRRGPRHAGAAPSYDAAAPPPGLFSRSDGASQRRCHGQPGCLETSQAPHLRTIEQRTVRPSGRYARPAASRPATCPSLLLRRRPLSRRSLSWSQRLKDLGRHRVNSSSGSM